jgi:MFS family permease
MRAMKPLSWARLMALTAFGFALTLVSNTLDPAIYGHTILEIAPENPNTVLGFATAAGSILSIFLAPIIGALSDGTRSPWGKRVPFFIAGVPIIVIALLTIGFASSVAMFVAGVLLYRVGDYLIFPVWEALYPDQVPSQQRGLAGGMKAFFDILAVVAGRFAAGELMARAAQGGDGYVVAAVAVPSLALVAALVIIWFALRGLSKAKISSQPKHISVIEMFKLDRRKHRDFVWWTVNRFFYWTGFVTIGTFLLFFVIDVIGLMEADAQRYIARLSLVLGGAILLAAIPAGRLADRVGRRPLIILSCALSAIGAALVVVFRDLDGLTIAAALVGLGAGIYNAASFALLTDIVPGKEAGRFLGLANIAGAGGGALARFAGGAIIDPLNAISGSIGTGYLTLYVLATVFFALSTWAAWRLPGPPIAK